MYILKIVQNESYLNTSLIEMVNYILIIELSLLYLQYIHTDCNKFAVIQNASINNGGVH